MAYKWNPFTNNLDDVGSGGGGGGITTITGDVGSATGASIFFNANTNAGSTLIFSASGAEVDLITTDLLNNTLVGNGAGNGTMAGGANTGIGAFVLGGLVDGFDNVGVGSAALGALTSGEKNVAIGPNCLDALSDGSYNVGIGNNVGTGGGGTGSESSNIHVNYVGTFNESNTLRIGNATGTGNQELNRAFIQGINGNSVSNTQMVTINSVTGQLGTQSIPGGIQSATVTLTSTDFKALDTVPFQLVAAQGANTYIIPTVISFVLHYGSSPFVNADEDTVTIFLGTYNSFAGIQSVFYEATQNISALLNGFGFGGDFLTSIVNLPLTLQSPSAITGNDEDDSTIVVTTYYIVQSVI